MSVFAIVEAECPYCDGIIHLRGARDGPDAIRHSEPSCSEYDGTGGDVDDPVIGAVYYSALWSH